MQTAVLLPAAAPRAQKAKRQRQDSVQGTAEGEDEEAGTSTSNKAGPVPRSPASKRRKGNEGAFTLGDVADSDHKEAARGAGQRRGSALNPSVQEEPRRRGRGRSRGRASSRGHSRSRRTTASALSDSPSGNSDDRKDNSNFGEESNCDPEHDTRTKRPLRGQGSRGGRGRSRGTGRSRGRGRSQRAASSGRDDSPPGSADDSPGIVVEENDDALEHKAKERRPLRGRGSRGGRGQGRSRGWQQGRGRGKSRRGASAGLSDSPPRSADDTTDDSDFDVDDSDDNWEDAGRTKKPLRGRGSRGRRGSRGGRATASRGGRRGNFRGGPGRGIKGPMQAAPVILGPDGVAISSLGWSRWYRPGSKFRDFECREPGQSPALPLALSATLKFCRNADL